MPFCFWVSRPSTGLWSMLSWDLQWGLRHAKKEESSRWPQGFSLWDPKPRWGCWGWAGP